MAAESQLQRLPVDFTASDQLPEISGSIAKFDGTGYTLELRVDRPDHSVLAIAGVWVSVSAAGSTFRFPWATTDLVEGMGQLCVVRMFNADGLPQTLARFLVDVGGLPE